MIGLVEKQSSMSGTRDWVQTGPGYQPITWRWRFERPWSAFDVSRGSMLGSPEWLWIQCQQDNHCRLDRTWTTRPGTYHSRTEFRTVGTPVAGLRYLPWAGIKRQMPLTGRSSVETNSIGHLRKQPHDTELEWKTPNFTRMLPNVTKRHQTLLDVTRCNQM